MIKSKTIVLDDPAYDFGRDYLKTFVLTEMPAYQAEVFAADAVASLRRAGIDVPTEYSGISLIAQVGTRVLLSCKEEDRERLRSQLLACVQVISEGETKPRGIIGPEDSDISESGTLQYLREAVFDLQSGFLRTRREFDGVDLFDEFSNQVALKQYPNVPANIGAVISKGYAKLHELQTVYGTEDLFDLIEVMGVNSYNERLIAERNRQE